MCSVCLGSPWLIVSWYLIKPLIGNPSHRIGMNRTSKVLFWLTFSYAKIRTNSVWFRPAPPFRRWPNGVTHMTPCHRKLLHPRNLIWKLTMKVSKGISSPGVNGFLWTFEVWRRLALQVYKKKNRLYTLSDHVLHGAQCFDRNLNLKKKHLLCAYMAYSIHEFHVQCFWHGFYIHFYQIAGCQLHWIPSSWGLWNSYLVPPSQLRSQGTTSIPNVCLRVSGPGTKLHNL